MKRGERGREREYDKEELEIEEPQDIGTNVRGTEQVAGPSLLIQSRKERLWIDGTQMI